MKNAASEEELGANQESNIDICGKEIKTEKSEGKQQKSEQNKEESS